MTPYNVLTPRSRQEMEPQRLMRTRRPMMVTPLPLAIRTLITAMPEADYIFEAAWGANVTSADVTYNMHIVTGSEAPSQANAIAFAVTMPANTTDIIVGVSGLMLAPGQSLVGSCSVANGFNVYGHGWDMMGDYQT